MRARTLLSTLGPLGVVAFLVAACSSPADPKLVVTDAGDGNASDHADWANARLVK